MPVLFAEVGETLIQFTDTALLGRVGTAELAAIGLVDAGVDLAIVPAVGLVEAMQIVVARRVGAGRGRVVAATFLRALLVVLAISAVLAAALRLGAGPVAERLIDSPEVARAVEDFFRFGAWGIVPFALNLAFSSLWVGLGRARMLIGATAVLVLVNLVVSWVLIFGALGLPALGIEGAGIGFLAAELAALAYLAVQTARRLEIADRWRGALERGSAGRRPIRGMARLGTPIGLQALVEALRWVGFFLIVESLGENALAWSSLVYACYAVLLIPSQALAETTYTMMSRALGRGEPGRIGRLMRAVSWRALAVTGPLLALAAVFPDFVLSLFTGDMVAVAGARTTLRVVAVGMLVVVAAEVWLAAVFGTGDTDAGFVIELLVSGSLVASAALAALVLDLELAYVWLSLPLAATLGLVCSVLWVRSGRWRRVAV